MSEIAVRLPDGKTLAVPVGSTVLEVAGRIGKGLAKAALAGRVDGVLVDLRTPLSADAAVCHVRSSSLSLRRSLRASRGSPMKLSSMNIT